MVKTSKKLIIQILFKIVCKQTLVFLLLLVIFLKLISKTMFSLYKKKERYKLFSFNLLKLDFKCPKIDKSLNSLHQKYFNLKGLNRCLCRFQFFKIKCIIFKNKIK